MLQLLSRLSLVYLLAQQRVCEYLWLCRWYIAPDVAQCSVIYLSECMFNYHLWLCHWYIAPDLLEGLQWTWIRENMFNLLSLTLSLIYRTWCCSMFSPLPQWVYVQLSSLTLSLIYRTWPARGTPMDVDPWEYVWFIVFDFVTDISHLMLLNVQSLASVSVCSIIIFDLIIDISHLTC